MFFRLLCPVSFESPISIIPREAVANEPIEIFRQQILSGETAANHKPMNVSETGIFQPPAEQHTPQNYLFVNPIQILTILWLLGVFLMLARAMVSYFKLKQKLTTATRLQDNIYVTDRLKYSFILGFLRPKVYLTTGLTVLEMDCVVSHERVHIKRGDHLLKPLAYFALALHWFNPIVWLAYHFMVKDMEMSCDESVLRKANGDIRLGYSSSLLAMSLKQSGIAFPVAFGESRTKSRIKNVLSYKRPVLWMVLVGVIAVTAIYMVLASNPMRLDVTHSEAVDESTESALTLDNNIQNPSADKAKYLHPNPEILDYDLFSQSIIDLFFKSKNIKITSYGKRNKIYLLDLAAEKGTPFYAPKEGTVKRAGWNGGYGYCVIIDHGDGVESRYGHCSELLVKKGDLVKVGQLIGKVGSTGNSTSPHLHFEVYENDVSIDPAKFLNIL